MLSIRPRSNTAANVVILTAGAIVEAALQAVFVIVVSRALGPEDFGYFGYIVAIFTFLLTLIHWGLPVTAVREMVQRPDEQATIWAATVRIRGLLGLLVFMGGIVLSGFEPDPVRSRAVLLLFAYGLFVPFDPAPLLDAHKLSRWDIVGRVGGRLVGVGLLLVLWQIGQGLTVAEVAACSTLVIAVNVVVNYRVVRGLGIWSNPWRGATPVLPLMAMSAHVMWQGLMPTVFNFSEPALVKWLANETETGYLSLTMRIVLPVILVKGVLARLLLPLFSEVVHERARTEHRFELAMPVMMCFFGLVTVIGIPAADALIVPVFGPEYLGAVVPIQIALSHFMVTGAAFLFGQILLARGEARTVTIALTIACAVSLIVSFLLIPTFGAVGAAWATLAGEVVGTFYSLPAFLRRYRPRVLIRSFKIMAALAPGLLGYYALKTWADVSPLTVLAATMGIAVVGLLVSGEGIRQRNQLREILGLRIRGGGTSCGA